MANRIDNLRKRATELTETKNELTEHKKINVADLSIVNELFDISFKDDDVLLDIDVLTKIITNEQETLESDISENKNFINETGDEAESFINELQKNLHEFEQMEKTTDLLNLEDQKRETEEKIEDLIEVKLILGFLH